MLCGLPYLASFTERGVQACPSSFFMAEQCVLCCIVFAHLSFGGPVGCLHLLAIMDNAAFYMNLDVPLF